MDNCEREWEQIVSDRVIYSSDPNVIDTELVKSVVANVKLDQYYNQVSLRDLFAAAALISWNYHAHDQTPEDYVAMRAYQIADAMLKAREAKQNG